jgi:SEL1 protein
MFNLAYMHEQGLGLKQDFYLAKRYYDQAAETSTDARVPVTLALIKLNVLSTLHSMKLMDGGEAGGLEDIVAILDFSGNWDLYVLSVLVGILGILVWFRRPQGG